MNVMRNIKKLYDTRVEIILFLMVFNFIALTEHPQVI